MEPRKGFLEEVRLNTLLSDMSWIKSVQVGSVPQKTESLMGCTAVTHQLKTERCGIHRQMSQKRYTRRAAHESQPCNAP